MCNAINLSANTQTKIFLPCPLALDLFAQEIKDREERRKARKREEEDYY